MRHSFALISNLLQNGSNINYYNLFREDETWYQDLKMYFLEILLDFVCLLWNALTQWSTHGEYFNRTCNKIRMSYARRKFSIMVDLRMIRVDCEGIIMNDSELCWEWTWNISMLVCLPVCHRGVVWTFPNIFLRRHLLLSGKFWIIHICLRCFIWTTHSAYSVSRFIFHPFSFSQFLNICFRQLRFASDTNIFDFYLLETKCHVTGKDLF